MGAWLADLGLHFQEITLTERALSTKFWLSDASHFVKLVLTDADVKAILTAWMNRGIRRNSTGR